MKLKWDKIAGFAYCTSIGPYDISVFGDPGSEEGLTWFIDTGHGELVATGGALDMEVASAITELTVRNIIEGEKTDEQDFYNDYGDCGGNLYGVRRRD